MKDKPFYYQDNRALHERKMNEAARLEISRRNIEFILEHQKDSAAELARYLRRCQAELGLVPAQSEILGGDLLALRFGSWVNALEYSGFSVSTGPAVSNFPLERTALFQAEYELRHIAVYGTGSVRRRCLFEERRVVVGPHCRETGVMEECCVQSGVRCFYGQA